MIFFDFGYWNHSIATREICFHEQHCNGKSSIFLTNVNLDTSEGNQLSYLFQKWQFFSKFFGDYCTNVTKFLPINLIDTSVELVGEEPDVGCTLSHWGPWGQCYSTCGPGIQTRQRSIL